MLHNSENQTVPRRLFKPKQKVSLINCVALSLYNKTLTQAPNDLVPKTTFRKGAESGFCLWQELKITKEKIARESDISGKIPILVRKAGIEPARLVVKGF